MPARLLSALCVLVVVILGPTPAMATHNQDCQVGAVVYGSDAGETMIGDGNCNDIDAKRGADYVYGRGARDDLYGGPGFDRVFGEGGDDHASGRNGDDYLAGGGGNDNLFDDSFDNDLDTTCGGDGDDHSNIKDGDIMDQFYGGAGSDNWTRDTTGSGNDSVSASGNCQNP